MLKHNKSDRCCYRAVFRIIRGKNMKNTIPIHVGPKFQGLIPARIQAVDLKPARLIRSVDPGNSPRIIRVDNFKWNNDF